MARTLRILRPERSARPLHRSLRYPAEHLERWATIACRQIFQLHNWSHRNWFRFEQAMGSRHTDNSSSLLTAAAMDANLLSSISTEVGRVKCCSAGIIAGSTRTTTEQISIWRAGVSLS